MSKSVLLCILCSLFSRLERKAPWSEMALYTTPQNTDMESITEGSNI